MKKLSNTEDELKKSVYFIYNEEYFFMNKTL